MLLLLQICLNLINYLHLNNNPALVLNEQFYNMRKIQILFALGIALIAIIATCYLYVDNISAGHTYCSIEKIPANRVGVLLGTNPKSRIGKRNTYYYNRIKATADLYKTGKIQRVLVSGDNNNKDYNEPDAMKNDLLKVGIPAEHIYLDYAGFRTLDTVVRAKEVFGLNEFTIISQKFHNERAVCIAHWKGISAIGYNAQEVTFSFGFLTHLRECFARVKFVYDMLVDKQPHFLGKQIKIE